MTLPAGIRPALVRGTAENGTCPVKLAVLMLLPRRAQPGVALPLHSIHLDPSASGQLGMGLRLRQHPLGELLG